MFNVERIEHMSPHRLDLATSGIVVFARNLKALRGLSEQFRERRVRKRYSAIVNGTWSRDSRGEMDLPIGRDSLIGPPCFTIDPIEGRPASTRWEVREKGKKCTHLSLEPLTGRTHQLRLHCAAVGHPILGDFLYSPPDVFLASSRLLLHAEELSLVHPETKMQMSLHAPTPFSLQEYDEVDDSADVYNDSGDDIEPQAAPR